MPNHVPLVLYIDDDPGIARLVGKVVRRHDFAFEHCLTGRDGLERIRAGGVDVLILDHHLAAETGLDVLNAMQDIADRPAVVYLTATADTAVAVAALKAGATDYLLKSVDDDFFELLGSAVENAVSIIRLSRAKSLAEQEMRIARERAETLLGEMNHRVANSLALVASLARLQAGASKTEETRAALAETQARIQAIAGVHRHLYTRGDAQSVRMDDYVSSLLGEMNGSAVADGATASIVVHAAPISISTKTAVSLGVILTELVTNALKYAYRDRPPGEIRVVLQSDGAQAVLRVEDDGVGYDGSGPPLGTGLGSRIVKAMVQTIGGHLGYGSADQGTVVSVTFPTGDR